MVDSVEDIVNQAARAAGVPLRVEEIYEGSDLSKVALELYGQCRDSLLDAEDWSFSRHTAPLTLLKGPPPDGGYNLTQPWSNIYPAPEWLFEFAYPQDMIDLRAIMPPPIGIMPDLDPVPVKWRVDNDSTPNVSGNPPVASGPPDKVIYTNVGPAALAVYRSRVTSPALFDPGFVDALVALLGKRFASSFGYEANQQREMAGEAVATINTQSDVRG
jgi:hypothetical protein